MKRILSVQDLSCAGKCSLTVALPVLSAMGCACTPLPTGILSSHTAFPNPHIHDLTEDMLPICRHWQKIGAEFETVCIGYLANPQQVSCVEQILEAFPSRVILDPVLGDHGKLYRGITEEHVSAMAALCKKADILLPNITEASLLTGTPYCKHPDMDYCNTLLHALDCESAILTGVSLSDETIGFVGMENGEFFSYQAPKCAAQSHGTGDLFAAVLAGAVTQGKSLEEAAKKAAFFVEEVLSAQKEITPFGLDFESQLPLLWE